MLKEYKHSKPSEDLSLLYIASDGALWVDQMKSDDITGEKIFVRHRITGLKKKDDKFYYTSDLTKRKK